MTAPYDFYNYQAYWKGRSFEDQCERLALSQLFSQIGRQKVLVDIGGGFGRLAPLYSPQFEKCLIIEPSEKLIKAGEEQLKAIENVSFKQGSLPKLSLPDESVDTVLLVRVSHHLSDLTPSLEEIHRILRKDGFLILEVANKIHFLARVKAYLSGDFSFSQNWAPVERRSPENIKEGTIAFSNHHPRKVMADLVGLGFRTKAILSVSNFRRPLLKKIFPQSFLLFWEKWLQKPLARFFFGPSIFLLVQKQN